MTKTKSEIKNKQLLAFLKKWDKKIKYVRTYQGETYPLDLKKEAKKLLKLKSLSVYRISKETTIPYTLLNNWKKAA